MNDLFLRLGISGLKPFVTVLLLPPVPFFLLSLVGIALVARVRRAGVAVLLTSLVLTWLSGCMGLAEALEPVLLHPPGPLGPQRLATLRTMNPARGAVIVLGGGVDDWAPEYRSGSLSGRSLERLRYGVWLGRQIGWPTGFSGGVGWGQPTRGGTAVTEAGTAQHIATEEFGRPLRWVESDSRDTRENAEKSIELLKRAGIRHVLLVTDGWHMPRALRNFERARGASAIDIEAAPMGLAADGSWPLMRWIPGGQGLLRLQAVVREWLGLRSGA